jgi:hypothetical protein
LKFTESLKHIPVGGEVGRLENSGRIFPCVVCRTPTGWRNNGDGTYPGVPVCSDECLDVTDEWEKESASNRTETERVQSTEPVLVRPEVSQTHERESGSEEAPTAEAVAG